MLRREIIVDDVGHVGIVLLTCGIGRAGGIGFAGRRNIIRHHRFLRRAKQHGRKNDVVEHGEVAEQRLSLRDEPERRVAQLRELLVRQLGDVSASISTVPDVGLSRPAIRLSSVLLPLPERPMMATSSPWSMEKLTWSTAAKRALRRVNSRVRSLISSIAMMNHSPSRNVR